jgi:hypothetical protein
MYQKGDFSVLLELFGRIFRQNILKYGLVVFTSFSVLPRIPQRLVILFLESEPSYRCR